MIPMMIAPTFEMILKKENYRIKALNTAEDMRNELVRIKLIGSVKAEAINMHEKTDLSPYLFAQQLIKKNHKLDIEIADIERLWDRKQSGIKHSNLGNGTKDDDPAIHTEPLKDYRFTKVHHIVLCGKEKIETRHWHEVKRAVYNYILKHKPGFQLAGSFRHSKDKTEFRTPLTLDDGYFYRIKFERIRHGKTLKKSNASSRL